MTVILYLVLSTIGGAVGWWLGDFVGMFTAFVLSTIGSGFGIYYARKISREYFG